MKSRVLPVVLIASALFATPSLANWFHNPQLNINRNIGSAPGPTPQDIREMRLPILVENDIDSRGTGNHPIMDALRSMFGGSKTAQVPAPAKVANTQTASTAQASR